jgi:hypothetical protein
MNVMYWVSNLKSICTTSIVSDMEERSPFGSTTVTLQDGAVLSLEEHTASTMPSDPAKPASQWQNEEAISLLECNEQVLQTPVPACAL